MAITDDFLDMEESPKSARDYNLQLISAGELGPHREVCDNSHLGVRVPGHASMYSDNGSLSPRSEAKETRHRNDEIVECVNPPTAWEVTNLG